jgi:hypothetical protein
MCFLGYSSMHKWFKCLDVAAGRVYISRDVVFDESLYPFSKLNPNADVRLRSEILQLPNHIQPNNLPTPGVKLIDCSNINAHVIPVTANTPLSSGQIAEISTSNDEATLGVQRTQSCTDQIVGADQITTTECPVTQSCADLIVCADQIAATGDPAAQSRTNQIVCADQIAATGGPVTQSYADQIVCADQIIATGDPAAQSCTDQIGGYVPILTSPPSSLLCLCLLHQYVQAPVFNMALGSLRYIQMGLYVMVFLLFLVSRIILMRH